MTDMDARDEAAAADFEQGWSGERIAAARRAWGPAVSDGLPVWLNRQLAERAHAGGRSELGIIQVRCIIRRDERIGICRVAHN